MPIYEYECSKCKDPFEAMQSISAKSLKTCIKSGCNGKVKRLVSASGFILKGSGWYTSDYPSDARKKGWESESNQDTKSNNKNSNEGASTEKSPASEPKASATEKPTTKSTPKKASQKNPYSGSKKTHAKTSK
jgi:putative FmdB family regulatory protein